MIELKTIINYLNNLLKVNDLDDVSNNGLQVGENKKVKKIAFAVDANLDIFTKAKDFDLLITHHGISWNDSLKYLTNVNFSRVKFLIENNLSLATYHLPLDKHEILGNNISLAKLFRMKRIKKFNVGFYGDLPKKVSVKTIANHLNKNLMTLCKIYEYGPKLNSSVSIISGSASRHLEKASLISDCFITGEDRYGDEAIAKELGINMIIAGHYETETLGLKNLMKLLNRKFKVEVKFIE